jgi:hypothetical protein
MTFFPTAVYPGMLSSTSKQGNKFFLFHQNKVASEFQTEASQRLPFFAGLAAIYQGSGPLTFSAK